MSLRPSELKVLYYIRTIPADSNQWRDLSIAQIAEDLHLHRGTVSRSLKDLEAKGLVKLRLTRVQAQLADRLSEWVLPHGHECAFPATNAIEKAHMSHSGHTCAFPATNAIEKAHMSHSGHTCAFPATNAIEKAHMSHFGQTPEPAAGKGFGKPVENLPVENSRSDLDQRSLNLSDDQLLQFVENANKHARHPRAYAKKCIQNDRDHWLKLYQEWSDRQTTLSISNTPNRYQIETACQIALENGDRPFVLAKLSGLWNDGFHDFVEQICLAWPQWLFFVSERGVIDGKG